MQYLPPQTRAQDRRPRRGYTLVMVALSLAVLVGMMGLVIDGGFLMFSHRISQNAADAAARACAIALHSGTPSEDLQGIAEVYVYTHNQVPVDAEPGSTSQVVVNNPPLIGAYAGNPNYVEVYVTYPVDTFFVHVLDTPRHNRVRSRAVAGFEARQRGAGVVVLDPRGRPAVAVSGTNAMLDVDSSVVVYSRQQGQNEYGDTVGQYAAGQPAVTVNGAGAKLLADMLYVSGGVDNMNNYLEPDVGELHAGTWDPVYDPFHDAATGPLPVPSVSNGVNSRELGDVSITTNSQSGLIAPNRYDDATQTTILYPGIYERITVNGGNVRLMPGIYVLRPRTNFGAGNILSVTGGQVIGEGIMLYNTSSLYDPDTGMPDQNDLGVSSEQVPPTVQGSEKFGGVQINGPAVRLTPIDTALYEYPDVSADISDFNRMLIYQRRANQQAISITDGESPPDGLKGTLYSKWANVQLSGQGTYNFVIVTGTLSVSGSAVVTVRDSIPLQPVIEPIRLVE